MNITNPDKYVILGLVGIFINLIVMFFSLRGKYTPQTLKGVTGLQGSRGSIGTQGYSGMTGLRGKKGHRGEDGNFGNIGLIGSSDGNTSGKRIFCATENCMKKNSDFHNKTLISDGIRIWPSDECINSGNVIANRITEHQVFDKNKHNIKCGYNWLWSDRKNIDSCVRSDIGQQFNDNSNLKWISGPTSEISPTLSKTKNGYAISTNNNKCLEECPECPGKNTRTKYCSRLNDYSRPSRVEGTCQKDSLEELASNSLIFCCNQDGNDIEKNRGSACKPKITEYCENPKNKEECRKNMGFSTENKFRDTISLDDRRCQIDENKNLPGGDKDIRNWCVGTWGCCRALTGVRRMRHESWRDAYCRNLQMGWIRASSSRNLTPGTKTLFQPISDKEKQRLESKGFVCRYVKTPKMVRRSIDNKGLGPCKGDGCSGLVQEVSEDYKTQKLVSGNDIGQSVPDELAEFKKGETTNYWSFLGENMSWGKSTGNPQSPDGGILNGNMIPITEFDDKNALAESGNLFFQCVHRDNLESEVNINNLKRCEGNVN